MQQAIAAIGATAFYTALKEANEQCRTIIDQRNADRAAASQEKMVNLRKATDLEYAHLIMITNAYALIDEQQRYNTLLQQLIEDVNYYEKTVFAGSGSAASGGSGSGTNENGGGTEQGGGGTNENENQNENGGGTEQGGGSGGGGSEVEEG